MWRPWLMYACLLTCCACSSGEKDAPAAHAHGPALFRSLTAEETGMRFTNTLEEREDFDVFRYRNYYNGGGVGIADFNNDGLSDVYMTSNMGDNKLFLNKGNWKFEDITTKAGVKGTKVWSTGVSIADVNADGLLDIYVCNAGDVKGNNRENELFINNGDLTFTEQAAAYGLADRGFSTHAAFLDYDKDGDLDCYVLNNSYRPVSTLGYRNLRNVRDEFGGHKLYRNDNGHFTDVSEQAGIYGSVIGFGLGVTVGDVNQDNWPDLYISNDFYERDYLYINNHDGTFKEKLEDYMGHISMFSMGADLADMDNDSYPEIFSTDMLPEDDYRLKTLTAFETYDVYQLRLRNGYYHQFMRNMLHRNNGDGTFSEIGTMAGMEATDWSWGALIADFDNDCYKEVYVCNGIYKDLINQDFIEYLGSSDQMRAAIEGKKIDFKQFVDRMPSAPQSNYMFTRTAPWQYKNVSEEWGLATPGFSNGAAYGDLDNDGDLDLVVNNVNMPMFVYQNLASEQNHHHALTLSFKGYDKNSFGLGACVKVYMGDEIIGMENMPIRGFQSSMDYRMVIGLGTRSQADSLLVTWPDGKTEMLRSVGADQALVLDHARATETKVDGKASRIASPLLQTVNEGTVRHEENDYNDFDRDRLNYHMLSTQGPAFAQADLNNDGRDDLYLGGSVGSPGKLYVQSTNGEFSPVPIEAFEADTLADIVDAAFFDADGDKDLDLYVVTGGSEHTGQSLALKDILYINEGLKKGKPAFSRSSGRIPDLYFSGSCISPADVDQDGDIDLFVGTRAIPSYYGLPCDQFLLINDGKGNFSDATVTMAPQLKRFGMVTDAVWFDYDSNGFKDLMIVGDWMPITVFSNNGKQLVRIDSVKGLDHTSGWWNRIEPADLDHDGDTDFVLGNLGLNSKFQPTLESPLTLYVNDFDQNGSIEPVFAYRKDGNEYPMALRQDLIKQMSSLKKKFVYYKDYAGKSIPDIFDAKLLERATVLKFNEPRTAILINDGGKGFQLKPLPIEAQVSPVYAIAVEDVNGDSHADILLGGNLFAVKPEVGRYDALHGLLLLGDGKGTFDPLPSNRSGISIKGEVRHIASVKSRNAATIAFVRNNDSVVFYKYKK
ncbi:VCBS repeat-containing protein [Fulvivirgaceae bacterium PWU4]|uniref:VCBS repeat-containing protein n=1 Tax=Chryseosolibacter histidini TaxID=2782349 RepID=A0AAP2DIA3_9BACT|nr:VCBS repeat-containing protein [Chryseosolibacter histidini]MBT1696871.1 VCBS repeat-containing protein [Chryseosolibacter histidini]